MFCCIPQAECITCFRFYVISKRKPYNILGPVNTSNTNIIIDMLRLKHFSAILNYSKRNFFALISKYYLLLLYNPTLRVMYWSRITIKINNDCIIILYSSEYCNLRISNEGIFAKISCFASNFANNQGIQLSFRENIYIRSIFMTCDYRATIEVIYVILCNDEMNVIEGIHFRYKQRTSLFACFTKSIKKAFVG